MKDCLSDTVTKALRDCLNAQKPLGELQSADVGVLIERMVMCYRACDGMTDPAAEIDRLRESEAGAAALREALVSTCGKWMLQERSFVEFAALRDTALASNAGRELLRERLAAMNEISKLVQERDEARAEAKRAWGCDTSHTVQLAIVVGHRDELLAEVKRMRDATATHERILGELQTRINDLDSIRIRVVEERDQVSSAMVSARMQLGEDDRSFVCDAIKALQDERTALQQDAVQAEAANTQMRQALTDARDWLAHYAWGLRSDAVSEPKSKHFDTVSSGVNAALAARLEANA